MNLFQKKFLSKKMINANEEYELIKQSTKSGLVKMKTVFHFRNNNQIYRSVSIRCTDTKQKERIDIIQEKIKNHKEQYSDENREK